MDLNSVLQALQYSIGKTQEEIRLAEQFLLQGRTMEGFMPNLLIIACNKEVTLHIRQAAVVSLKSTIQDGWARTPDHNKSLPQNDKNTLRESILEAIIKCYDTPKIYRQIEEIIKCIGYCDFPHVWTSVLPNIINILKTSNKFNEIFGSLLTLKSLMAKYKFESGDQRKQIEVLLSNTFPLLEVYAKNLVENYNEEAALAMHVILKIFYSATYVELESYFFDEKVLETWMTIFKIIVDKPLGQELEGQTDDRNAITQRSRNVFWLNKKNSARIVSYFMSRYTNVIPKNNPDALSIVSQILLTKYAVPFLESFVQIIYKKKEQFVPLKVLFFALKYVYRALNFEDLSRLLMSHHEYFLFEFLIPAMFLTVDDDDDWSNNPIEFIRKEEDIVERPNNIKSPVKDYIITICAENFAAPDGELYLLKFMKYAAHILTTGVDPRTNAQTDLRMKEALMHIIGVLKLQILSNTYLRDNMEYLLEKYITPEFKSNVGFLRYRACWLFGIYGNLEYKNEQNVRNAVEGLYNCLLDSQFPVRVKAAIAMSDLLEQPEAIKTLKPGLQKILEIYINLIDLMDNDDLVNALEEIISQFDNEIHPFALELAQHLANRFFRAHNTNDDDGDSSDAEEEAERGFAATEYLTAIIKIMNCDLQKETFDKFEEIVLPIIEFSLSEEGMSYIESGLTMLGNILFTADTISEKLWHLFPELNYIVAGKPEELLQKNFDHLPEEKKALIREQSTGWAYEFVDDIIPCFQNYIQKGRDVIFTARDPYFNITYLELLFRSIDRIFQLYYTKKNQIEAVLMAVLYVTLLENYPKQIDNLVPYILDKVITNLPIGETDMKKILIEIVAVALWYDPQLCLQYLESKGQTEYIFKTWIELLNKYSQDYEVQRLLFGLSSLLRMNVANIPQIVLTSLPGLLKEIVGLTTKALELREREDSIEDYEEEKKALLQLQKMNQQGGDDGDEGFNDIENFQPTAKGDYSSPIEDQCEILYLKESLTILQQTQPDAYNQLISCLSGQEKDTLQKNIEKAEVQQLEFEQFKQEENQKRQMKAQ